MVQPRLSRVYDLESSFRDPTPHQPEGTTPSSALPKRKAPSHLSKVRDHLFHSFWNDKLTPDSAIFSQLKQTIETTGPKPTRPQPNQVHSFTIPSAVQRQQPTNLLAVSPMRWTASAPTTPVVASTPRFDGRQSPGSVQLPSAIRF